jgi:amino acid adenylation domain-containing protein
VTLSLPTPVDAPTLAAALQTAALDYRSAAAIVTASVTWTYEDLAANMHAVAAGVAARTSGDSPVVAVVLERCPEFVATVSGIVAAGAVYLPLDPDAPDAYLRQVFAEARPALVVTSAERAERLAAATDASVCAYPDLLAAAASGSAPATVGVAAPSDPAYVIYTSGSTGTPKGVLVPHTALLNSTAARVDQYGPAGRVLLLHSPAFDLTTGIMFWVLLTGGTLVIDRTRLVDVAATVDLVHRHGITQLIYPASLYSVFLDRAANHPPATLLAVGIGSERWSPAVIDRHAAVLPRTSLVNEYGPTEACVCSSYGLVYDAATGHTSPMSIGRPVRGTEYLLLDGDRRPAAGFGELAITGANLAIGYLAQPSLTRQRFVPIDGERAYLTGDLVERDQHGNIVFLERADRQVQIGGHRVEPGHVETVLMGHPAVLQAHVTGRCGPSGSSVLVAYVVPMPGTTSWRHPAGEVLDSYLRERLPAYLLPSAYVMLTDLPRTPAGKIDDSELPPPGDSGEDAGGEVADPLQRYLADTAAGILSVAHVPVQRPLSALGANSLALIQLAAAIAADRGVDVAISALFCARTIEQIADLVREAVPVTRQLLPHAAAGGVRFPLSGQQEQIWVLTQLAPDARAYNTQFSLLLDGPVDGGALQTALTLIVARHEILRTTFHDGPDGPVQVVHEPWPAVVDVVDLTGLDESARDVDLAARMQATVGEGFDVARLPLVRWQLFHLAPDRWRLLQVEHHFAHDGWSAQLFLTELRDAYTQLAAGREPELPPLPAQYRDFATWYQSWRGTDDFAAQLTYWREKLAGCPDEGVTFTPDHTRPMARSFRGGRLSAHIGAPVLQRLDELADRHRVSRFTVFLTAFAVQVWQHTGEQDIVVGSALVNRRLPGTDRLLGMFVNALPLRVRIDPAAQLDDLLRATMDVVLGAQDHQELPLLDLLAHLDRRRDPGRNPLFNLMFAFHDTPRPRLQMGPVRAELVIEHNGTAKGDLNVVCVPDPRHHGDGPAGMTILWEYDSDLFHPDTAADLLTGFETLLTLLAQADDRPMRDLDLLGVDETARILAASAGAVEPVPFETLHAGFDAAAAAYPHAVAFEQTGSRWTYHQLAEHTARLQKHLSTRGIRAGSIVAIICPAGIELVTAILATLRAGAAYVCLDPTQPHARTVAMLDDAAANAIVTTRPVVDTLPLREARYGRHVLRADDLPTDLPASVGYVEVPPVKPDDPAYLIYTSGSTGTPKAVIATHRNACAAAHARTRFLHTAGTGTQPGRTLVTLPAIFDLAPHMIMWTLWSGGTVVVPDSAAQAQDPDEILAVIQRDAITHVNFTASFYRHLLTRVPPGWRSALQVVAVGGEACHADDVKEHAVRLPAVALDHEYGPTETTAWCSAQRLHPAAQAISSRVTVGRPLTNYTMTVLDSAGKLAPIGAAGELVIGGAGVAAGYHRRNDLTRERFITPETGPLTGRRLYRTGDRARLTADGFEILGRLDEQVKIRGYRVELGEITAQLLRHPDVTDAAVLARPTADTTQLIAYIATAADHHGDLGIRIKAWLAQHLPSYMIPARYVITDRLPRTATGKIQTGNLPEVPDTTGDESGSGPATDRQWLLTRVWRDILHQPTLGIDDDFFASGGDSLQAIQVAARATTLGVQLSVADLLAAPTIRALDILLTNRPEPDALPVVERRPGCTALRLTPIQMWFFTQHLVDPDHFHQARLFEIPASCDRTRLLAALAWVVDRHDAFRTRFIDTDDTWAAVLADQPHPDLIQEHTLPRGADSTTSARLDTALRGMHRTISIADGRLAAVTIVHDPDSDRRWLYLIAHHLIVDVVSWHTLTTDVDHAYRMLSDGLPLPAGAAPGLPERDSDSGEPDPDPRRWQALATAAKPRLTGATTSAPATVAERIQVTRTLSERAGTYLRLDVPRLHGIGAQPVLLAALHRSIAAYSTRAGLYVWLEGHGRTATGAHRLEHVVGWLTSLHPVLFTVEQGHPARLLDAATSIHRQIAAAPTAGAEFGETILMHPGSQLHQELTATGLPQITFNYLGRPGDTSDWLLQPARSPHDATIGGSNVLPTPFDVTVAPAGDGTVTCHFSADPALLAAADVQQVADRFAAELETAARLVPLTATPIVQPARTLFLIHPVGGLIDWYLPLATGLGAGWDCYGIPRERTGHDTTLPALARTYLGRIRAAHPTGHYTLAGWCMGGPLAYEIARQAHSDGDGDRIDDVILIDPPRAEQPANPQGALIAHIHNACPHQLRPAVVDAITATAHLPIPQRAAALVERLGTAGPGRSDSLLLGQMLMRLSDHAAMSAWQPTGLVPHLTLYLPWTVTPDNVNAVDSWRPHSATMTAITVPGNHESMLTTADFHRGIADLARTLVRSDSRR